MWVRLQGGGSERQPRSSRGQVPIHHSRQGGSLGALSQQSQGSRMSQGSDITPQPPGPPRSASPPPTCLWGILAGGRRRKGPVPPSLPPPGPPVQLEGNRSRLARTSDYRRGAQLVDLLSLAWLLTGPHPPPPLLQCGHAPAQASGPGWQAQAATGRGTYAAGHHPAKHDAPGLLPAT